MSSLLLFDVCLDYFRVLCGFAGSRKSLVSEQPVGRRYVYSRRSIWFSVPLSSKIPPETLVPIAYVVVAIDLVNGIKSQNSHHKLPLILNIRRRRLVSGGILGCIPTPSFSSLA